MVGLKELPPPDDEVPVPSERPCKEDSEGVARWVERRERFGEEGGSVAFVREGRAKEWGREGLVGEDGVVGRKGRCDMMHGVGEGRGRRNRDAQRVPERKKKVRKLCRRKSRIAGQAVDVKNCSNIFHLQHAVPAPSYTAPFGPSHEAALSRTNYVKWKHAVSIYHNVNAKTTLPSFPPILFRNH